MCKQYTVAINLINLCCKIHWYRSNYANQISCMYLSCLPTKPIGTILTHWNLEPPCLQIPILHHVTRGLFQFLNACLIRFVSYQVRAWEIVEIDVISTRQHSQMVRTHLPVHLEYFSNPKFPRWNPSTSRSQYCITSWDNNNKIAYQNITNNLRYKLLVGLFRPPPTKKTAT